MTTTPSAYPIRRRTVLGATAGAGIAASLGFGWAPSAHAYTPGIPVKTRATYYTTERVAAARFNVANYDWAKAVLAANLTAADKFAGLDPQWLWRHVTTQGMPRSYGVNQTLGSPDTGLEINKFGNYPWLGDYAKPFELIDPTTNNVFPTNDFAKFYESAIDPHGNFDRSLGDPQYLVNIRRPDKPADWGVDDGYGWKDDNGKNWTFVPYYNHWFSWYSTTAMLGTALAAAAQTFVLTGDVKYARNLVVALARIGMVYPSMDATAYRREDGYLQSDGLSGRGKVIGSIWETGLVRNFCVAYDAVFPAIATTDTTGALDIIAPLAAAIGKDLSTIEKVRATIEEGILRQVRPNVEAANIRGNYGMHQSALIAAAVVQDDPDATPEWLEFAFKPGVTGATAVTGGDILGYVLSSVDRDGFGNEASPDYNDLWPNQMALMATYLDGYDRFAGADLYRHPSVARLFTGTNRLAMLNRYTPPIGDTGATGRPGLLGTAGRHARVFQLYGREEDAQLAWLLNGGTAEGMTFDILTVGVPELQAEIEKVVASKGELALPSAHKSGYGAAFIRQGTGPTMRGMMVYYGRTSGHGQLDALNLNLWGLGVDLAPDLGYPEFADNTIRRVEWIETSACHNLLMIDARPQKEAYTGRPHAYVAEAGIGHIDVSAPSAYPSATRYRRSSTMVEIDDKNSYVIDIFRAIGGSQHHYLFHGAEGAVTTQGLSLVAQPTGTYAGPTIPVPPDNQPPNGQASGFNFLSNVSRDAKPPASFSLDYDIVDTWQVDTSERSRHLKVSVLTQFDEVALADGEPPRNKPGNPAKLRYLIGKRSGTNLNTTVVSALEAYESSSAITEVVQVSAKAKVALNPGDVVAVRVKLANGRTDYLVHSLRPDLELNIDQSFTFQGTFGFWSVVAGKATRAVINDASLLNLRATAPGTVSGLQPLPPSFTGTLASFTSDLDRGPDPGPDATSELVVTPTVGTDLAAMAKEVVGREIYFDSSTRAAVYRIASAVVSGNQIILDLGVTTLVAGYVERFDPDSGYAYDVTVGQAWRIPRLRRWSV